MAGSPVEPPTTWSVTARVLAGLAPGLLMSARPRNLDLQTRFGAMRVRHAAEHSCSTATGATLPETVRPSRRRSPSGSRPALLDVFWDGLSPQAYPSSAPSEVLPSEFFDVAGGDGLRWVGVALDIALGAVAQPSLQLVGVGARHLGQVEGESVP